MQMKRSRNPETLLSVIVPYRERQQELLELLNSIPDRDDVEVLLINDHGERLEINPLEFTKVVHVEIPEGRRHAGAGRNVGIDNSSGQFICFADMIQSESVCNKIFRMDAPTVDALHQLFHFPNAGYP